MKIYTQVFDIALQSPKRFWVAPYSDFKIGVKIVKNGTPVDNEFAVKQGSTTLTSDSTTVDGFTTYTLKSGDSGYVEYQIKIDGVEETQKLTQIVTNSTVFEVGGEGGGSGVSESWVESYVSTATSEFITGTQADQKISAATSEFATSSEVDSAISLATSTFVSATDVEDIVSLATSEFVSATDVEGIVSTATSTFVSATDVATTISASLVGYATTSYVDSQIGAVLSQSF